MKKSTALAELRSFDRSAIVRFKTVAECRKAAAALEGIHVVLKRANAAAEKLNEVTALRACVVRRAGQLLDENLPHKGGRPSKKTVTHVLPFSLKEFGIGKMTSSRWQALAKIVDKEFDEFVEKLSRCHDRVSMRDIYMYARRQRATKEKPPVTGNGTVELICCECAKLHEHVPRETVDAIITDPPYGLDQLDCWSQLASFAVHALKPGSSLIALSGQSGLDQIIGVLVDGGLNFYWMGCVYQPEVPTRIFDKAIQCHWKPILWLTKGARVLADPPDWIRDVVNVKYAPETARLEHTWEQSLEATRILVRRWSQPGWTICDPFLGSGTTAIAAVEHDCHCIGADSDERCVNSLRERLGATSEKTRTEDSTRKKMGKRKH